MSSSLNFQPDSLKLKHKSICLYSGRKNEDSEEFWWLFWCYSSKTIFNYRNKFLYLILILWELCNQNLDVGTMQCERSLEFLELRWFNKKNFKMQLWRNSYKQEHFLNVSSAKVRRHSKRNIWKGVLRISAWNMETKFIACTGEGSLLWAEITTQP